MLTTPVVHQQLALTFATTAAGLVGKAANPAWAETASKLVILFNGTYHPEYEGYAPPTVIKQADVILLGFPLMVEGPEYHMTKEVRKADLDIYGAVTGDEELSIVGGGYFLLTVLTNAVSRRHYHLQMPMALP